MKGSFIGVVKHVFLGHCVGLAVLGLLSCAAMMLPYPSESVMLSGLLPLMVGAFFMGIFEKREGVMLTEAIAAGIVYAILPLTVSLFGKGELFSLGIKLLLSAVALMLSLIPSLCFHKKKKRRRVTRR